jgi:hypothetical protein
MSNTSACDPVNSFRNSRRKHAHEFDAVEPSHSKFAKRSSSFKDSIFAPYPGNSALVSSDYHDNFRYHESTNRLADASVGTIQGGDPSLLDIIDDPYAYDNNGIRHKSFLIEHDMPHKSTLKHAQSHVHLSYCPVHSELDVRYLNDVSSANLNRSLSLKGSRNGLIIFKLNTSS